MSEIRMSYIFIEKKTHESKSLEEILIEIIESNTKRNTASNVSVNDVDIEYRIIQKANPKRCYLEMISNARVNKATSALCTLDEVLMKSSLQEYYYSIRDYDGISESFCKRLYPKYAEFERNLRSLILLILTKAYGSKWRSETVSNELLGAIKSRANGNVSLNETLENMDLAMLEDYLFKRREADYVYVLSESLSKSNLEKMTKEDICNVIEEMRPMSLWECHFEKYGKQEEWEKRIGEIHDTRNKVAHQKTISLQEYTAVSQKMRLLNRRLEEVILGIREENFTEYGMVDVLGSFAIMIGNLLNNIDFEEAIRNVITSFSTKIQEIVTSIAGAWNNNMLTSLGRLAQLCGDVEVSQFEIEEKNVVDE